MEEGFFRTEPPEPSPARARPDLWLFERAVADADKAALIFQDHALSYAALGERVRRLAAGLTHQGVTAGDRIACVSSNHPAFLETYFAASLLGAVFVPLNFRLAPPELAFQIHDCAPAVLILGPRQHELARRLRAEALPACGRVFLVSPQPPDPHMPTSDRRMAAYEILLAGEAASYEAAARRPFAAEDPQLILYTSGTTGIPKGAVLPFRKTLYNSLNASIFFELSAADRVLVPTPLFHSLGLNILSIPVLFQGGTVILMDRFEPQAALEAIEQHRITFMGAVPTIYKRLLDHGLDQADLSSVRFFFTAGAPIPVPVIEDYHRRGILLKQGFGQTESSILCCLDAQDAVRKAGSVGKPVVHAVVRVVDEHLEDVPPGVVGEIVAKGPIVMLGYWNRPEETARALAGSWLHTQDLARRDEEGFFTLAGRKGDMYISGGENIYPEEVEKVFLTHPDVVEIAVLGVPDPDLGEVGLACVVLRAGADLDEENLRSFAVGKLARYKIPRRFLRRKTLPHTETGKIQKFILRESLSPTMPGSQSRPE